MRACVDAMQLAPTTLLVAIMIAGAPALAQAPEGRRRIYPTEDGFVEIDPRAGAVLECKRSPGGYQCHRVTDSDPLLKEDSGPQAQAPTTPPQPPTTARP